MGTYIEKIDSFDKNLKLIKEGTTITISGLSGSGKSTIGKAIAEKLNLKYKNMGTIFREIAEEEGISIEEFSKKREEEKDILLDKKCLKLAKKGNVLLNGRLTGWVAGDYAEIRIWIKCDLNTRAERVSGRENKNFEEAKEDIIQRDAADKKRYKELYGINAENTEIYNYIFDNGKATYQEAITKPIKDIKSLLDKTSN